MNRRTALLNLSLSLGCSVASLNSFAVTSALAYEGKPPTKLEKDVLEVLRTIADIIIPETESPSASRAGVHLYMDFFLHDFYAEANRIIFLEGLDKITSSPSAFLARSLDDQTQLIQALDDQLGSDKENATYRELKELIVMAYFTSEIGATESLKFDPVPGEYKEIKLQKSGRAWY